MPIYEFYCPDCHTIFRFLSRKILSGGEGERRPSCPRCGRPEIERQVSVFAVSRSRPEGGGEEKASGEDDLPDVDESRLESAFESLEREVDGLDEEDPRQAARLMRRLYDATGLKLGPAMEEAIRRLGGGEDPDASEEERGDAREAEDP
ncbi:MAG: FmdB family zinc ribbon protein, partial [Planctomycetota bacterium]